MPPLKSSHPKDGPRLNEYARPVFLGIDPGLSGGLALLDGQQTEAVAMPATERDLWDWLSQWQAGTVQNYHTQAVIEQIDPRPTYWFDKASKGWKSSILKSTCLLYANYMQLRGMLIAAGISFVECPPARWQKALNIPGKKKTETPAKWKVRLKSRAQQLFPQQKVTLAIADALLIAEFCRQEHEWRTPKPTEVLGARTGD